MFIRSVHPSVLMPICPYMHCHDLEVMSSNPSRVKLGVHSVSVLSHT